MAAVDVGRRAAAGTVHSLMNANKLGSEDFIPTPSPAYINQRVECFDRLLQSQNITQQKKEISIELPDGKLVQGMSYETTPYSIAMTISKGLADASLCAKIHYTDSDIKRMHMADADNDEIEENEEEGCCCHSDETWEIVDMHRPLEGSCKLALLKYDAPEAKQVFLHSSAHILGRAIENLYGGQLTIGPALEQGFYYDFYFGTQTVTDTMYTAIENSMLEFAKKNHPFQRLICTKEQALELFKDNPFKVALISSKIPDDGYTTVYKCGDFIDLCRGPHLPSTSYCKAIWIYKSSSTYWLGKSNLDNLQRIYGVAFPDKKLLKEYKTLIEQAKLRDHRNIGNNLQLFFFDANVSPGSCFWLPDGAKMFNKLCDFIRSEYRKRGFQEVITPNIFSCDLWKQSGHYQNYKENMYLFDIEGREWGLKPMNCPGHCIIFKHMAPSYRQLPVRLADFGVLHRNEISGSLTGLTRVRRFQQDDAHIFCRMDQIEAEVCAALDFLFSVYDQFGFKYELHLSTRPKKALGELDQWNAAETALKSALDSTERQWKLNPGDGAFYGPKIDIKLFDALKRPHQCGTIQLDFQLPIRFNLQYRTQEEAVHVEKTEEVDEKCQDENYQGKLRPGMARPVIIHRAILGSIERMCAVLLEHTAGKLPFWLSPRQCIVLPISDKSLQYAMKVRDELYNKGLETSLDTSNNTINRKIREAQLQQWSYLLVVGEKEAAENTVTVRNRDSPDKQKTLKLEEVIDEMYKLSQTYSQATI